MLFETIWQDTVYALRTMRKAPAFVAAAVLTLALGIGGNTTIFSVIRAVLLKPLDYREPDRLVYFSVDVPRKGTEDMSFSLAQFQELSVAAKSFSGMGAYGRPENVMFSDGDPVSLKGARVSANFLDVLGVQPIAGRSFLAEEDVRGARPVAMISASLWQRRFSGDSKIVGRTVTIDAQPSAIVGVLPEGFEFPYADIDVWVPRPSEWSMVPERYWGLPTLLGFARLKPGVTFEQGRAELKLLEQQFAAAHPNPALDGSATMRVIALKDRMVSDVRPMLWTLFGAAGFVLLIACANVASLLLARATSRSREFAVRAALGAGRWRLIRQLLAESLLLAVFGGALGVMLAVWGLSAISHAGALVIPRATNPLTLPGSGEVRLDVLVLVFTIALSVATGILFGLFPSLQVSRPDLAGALRETGAGAGRSARTFFGVSARDLLVVGQVGLSIVLLIGAALLMQSFVRLRSVNPGFQPANLLTAKIALPAARYDTDQKRAVFYRELVSRLESVPGVRGAAVVSTLPTTTWIRTNLLWVEGGPELTPEDPTAFGVIQSITPGYFRALGIPMRAGREFTDRDNVPGAAPVMIVNESLARRLWRGYPRDNPIGRHIREGYDKTLGAIEVVGIAADIHEGGLATDVVQEFYLPSTVHPAQTAYVTLRTEGNPLQFANALRGRVLQVDADQSISEVRTMDAVLEATLGRRKLTLALIGTFAGVALVLALIGIYGVIAYSVAQRTQEMGIRRALGAQQGDILRLVLRHGLMLALAGGVTGIGGAVALTRVMRGFLFHVSATDPVTFAGVVLLFMLVALAASFIPAKRAASVDPMAALRV